LVCPGGVRVWPGGVADGFAVRPLAEPLGVGSVTPVEDAAPLADGTGWDDRAGELLCG
jgi:hypothetical protein